MRCCIRSSWACSSATSAVSTATAPASGGTSTCRDSGADHAGAPVGTAGPATSSTSIWTSPASLPKSSGRRTGRCPAQLGQTGSSRRQPAVPDPVSASNAEARPQRHGRSRTVRTRCREYRSPSS